MAEVVVVYWRDMPAQVIAGRGRRATKLALSSRFEEAIDRAAMKSGASGTDAYLADWRRAAPVEVEGDEESAARAMCDRLEAKYDGERLKALIANDGRA